jgi:hypothetical protein
MEINIKKGTAKIFCIIATDLEELALCRLSAIFQALFLMSTNKNQPKTMYTKPGPCNSQTTPV